MTRHHRPMFKMPRISESLYSEMSGGGWAQEERPDLFTKMISQANLTYEETVEAREGIDITREAIEAIKGGSTMDFAEARTLNAAYRSVNALIKKLDAYLLTNA